MENFEEKNLSRQTASEGFLVDFAEVGQLKEARRDVGPEADGAQVGAQRLARLLDGRDRRQIQTRHLVLERRVPARLRRQRFQSQRNQCRKRIFYIESLLKHFKNEKREPNQ